MWHDSSEATAVELPRTYVLYIHGGCWGDPAINVTKALQPTVAHLSSAYPVTLSQVGGLASIDYRLSPYPDHPTDPSGDDPDRNVRHPQHMHDVVQAIQKLQREYNIKRWIGVGHSCGASILCHILGQLSLDASHTIIRPEALILISGIYDLKGLLQYRFPPAFPQEVFDVYTAFFERAFGSDHSIYDSISPLAMKLDEKNWPEGKLIVVSHSPDEELVEPEQSDLMRAELPRQGWQVIMGEESLDSKLEPGKRVVNVASIKGAHRFVWNDGQQTASLISRVVRKLN
ncbi:hypothetical protein IAQ61_005901 [Plenodomus lingam]|uniref:uncharacterized protein n=1 Tax=Leptosphaeria maculans TaxID=5022 RepID=UPI0033280A9D|nr:hypothetical protein IAQ61_005901 [Plenodomus lingam]